MKLLEAPNDIILKLEELNTILPDDVYVWSFSENDYSQALSNYGDIALDLIVREYGATCKIITQRQENT